MQFNTFVQSVTDLDPCVKAPNLSEVLLEPVGFTRQGQRSGEQVQALARQAKQRGLQTVLVWDILTPERIMPGLIQQLSGWDLTVFDAIRVCDPGVAWWVKHHLPELPIQLIVETGNHNLEALQGWCELFGNTLNRLILSIELPEQKLVEYCQTLPVPCEILGVGPILLFYSPRLLLSPQLSEQNREVSGALAATIQSEDSGNRPFPVLETDQGTQMFLDKDQFILDQLETLTQAGLQTLRLDLRHLKNTVEIDQICQQILSDPISLKASWPRPTRSPFFKVNRTTSIFSRIKSKPKLSQQRHQQALAEILTGKNGEYVVFHSLRSFDISQAQYLALTTGQDLELPSDLEFRNLDGNLLETCEPEQIFLTNWIKNAMPGSLLL